MTEHDPFDLDPDSDADAGDSTATRRTVLEGLAGAAGLSALAGCSSEAVPGNDAGETLRYAQVLPPLQLDPVALDDPWTGQSAGMTFQALYTYDRELNLVPELAAGPPEVGGDGTTYTVSLAEGATFQDGSPVLAEDVKYSYEAPVEEETPPLWQVNMISEIGVPDERTVVFRLAHPYPAFGHSLTRGVVPKHVREENPDVFGTEVVVGSGPYEPRIVKPGSYAVFDAWPEFWGAPEPGVGTVKTIGNHAGFARTMALKTGQSDIVERVQPDFWRATDRFAGADVVSTRSFNSHFVGFNCNDEPTADPKVREAVDYVLSMDDFVEQVVRPAGRRQVSPLPDRLAKEWGFPLDEWRGVARKRSRRKAKALFEEADVSGWDPVIAVPHDDMLRQKLGTELATGLSRVGFRRARIKKYHWREFRETVTSGNVDDYSMYVGSWAGFDDPDTFLYPLFHRSMEGLTNGTYYRNPDLMEKIAAARKTTNRERRRRLYESVITTLLEERVHIPAYTLDNSFGVKEYVSGFEPHPLAQINPRLVSRDGAVSVENDSSGFEFL